MIDRPANAHPCFMPLTIKGSDAGSITKTSVYSGFAPIVRAAREKIGGTLRTPLSVAMTMDHSEPMMTTKSIVFSFCPTSGSASGTQQTLGKVWSPSARTPMVSPKILNRAVSSPSGMPITQC